MLEKTGRTICLMMSCLLVLCGMAKGESVAELIKQSSFKGGLVVHVGCEDGKETVNLGVAPEFLVHALDSSEQNVSATRKAIGLAAKGQHIIADRLYGKKLPYTDNLVNIIVTETESAKRLGVSEEEMQWVAGPRYTRQHGSHPTLTGMVSAGGRLFYIVDEGPISLMDYPPQWFLVARDAFNGRLLWKKKISHMWPEGRSFKSVSYMYQHRVVATTKRLFVTLGLSKPVSEIDPLTGRTAKTFEGAEHAVKFFATGSTLLVVTSDYGSEAETYQAIRRGKELAPGYDRKIMAMDIPTGKCLWKKEGASLAATKEKLFVAGWNEEPVEGSEENVSELRLRKTGDGALWVCDKKDGKVLNKYELPSGAIFDGVAIAQERVFISLEDGSVVC